MEGLKLERLGYTVVMSSGTRKGKDQRTRRSGWRATFLWRLEKELKED